MDIRIARENMGYFTKKGALAFRFDATGKDGMVVSQGNKHTCVLKIDESEKVTRRKLILLVRRVVYEALAKKYTTVVLDFKQFRFPKIVITDEELAELMATNFLMAHFAFRDFLTKPKEGWPEIKTIVLTNAGTKEVKAGIERGKIIGEEVNRSRHIATMPGGHMTPEILAKHAEVSVKGLPVKVRVLGVPEMTRLKMGGVLGVGKGSDAKPCFIILEYFGGKKNEKPVVLVGKGVTFDTGGINLKPSDYILGMNMDMSGGAAVIHSLAAAARLKLKKNVVALIPAVENMPSGSSYRPGDILHSMSGKTIEVLNTDAEGRIILADALIYAKRYHPALVVDVATLTGAAMGALGERASALFTQDEKLELQIRHLGEATGDYVWPMPLWDEYDDEVKGTFGDVANLGKTRYGGAVTAAVFLKQFVDNSYPWVHLDIAPRMTTLPDEFLAKGSAGAPVRLLVKILEKL
ncbi:MAG: leucyl aminopeptidase family protein [Candidatus Moranbacteria bacterium]|nr:leucyl aminopeptidase family protein [Candidatus Moranbacteria bacterium]